MDGLFNAEGPIFRFLSGIADAMVISVVWLLFSLPIFTIGASTTALFYVLTRRIADRDGYLLRDFFSSFKSNFKRATLLWLIWMVLIGAILFNLRLLTVFEFDAVITAVLIPIKVAILIELYITSVYLFPVTARFEMGFLESIKAAFFMANRHVLTTLTVITTVVGIGFAIVMFPPFIIISVGAYGYIVSYLVMNVFKKYRPGMDEDVIPPVD